MMAKHAKIKPSQHPHVYSIKAFDDSNSDDTGEKKKKDATFLPDSQKFKQ